MNTLLFNLVAVLSAARTVTNCRKLRSNSKETEGHRPIRRTRPVQTTSGSLVPDLLRAALAPRILHSSAVSGIHGAVVDVQ